MKLLGSRLLVSPIAAKLLSIGGIHLLPDNVQHEKLWRVIDVGPGVDGEIRAGDSVLVPDWAHRADIADGQRIIDQKEVIAVIRQE